MRWDCNAGERRRDLQGRVRAPWKRFPGPPPPDAEIPRRFPRGCGVDFRKLGLEALRTYINRYRLAVRSDANEAELAAAVARHFEAVPVDEEAIVARFFEHLDSVDSADGGDEDAGGAAKVHEQVAAKVSAGDENGAWILASVVKYDPTSDAYAVQDEDDSKIIELPSVKVRRLGMAEDALDELQKGERVLAIFPETTSFYKAVVCVSPAFLRDPSSAIKRKPPRRVQPPPPPARA